MKNDKDKNTNAIQEKKNEITYDMQCGLIATEIKYVQRELECVNIRLKNILNMMAGGAVVTPILCAIGLVVLFFIK